MKNLISVSLLLIAASSVHSAGIPKSIPATPLADCIIQSIVNTSMVHSILRRGELTAQSIELLEKMKKMQ